MLKSDWPYTALKFLNHILSWLKVNTPSVIVNGCGKYSDTVLISLNSNVPSQSYIQLAKGGPPQSDQLTVNEVWDLPMQRVDLVTLSACETALSQRNPDGGDITTLAEAFSSAGATSVVCSLWNVADESTRDLMVEFYKQLAAGANKGAALRAAELKVMRNPQTAHPFYWAPFILMGDWR